jgi:mRNA deadenylase 3'-5' endonuclease subunit Ccr4
MIWLLCGMLLLSPLLCSALLCSPEATCISMKEHATVLLFITKPLIIQRVFSTKTPHPHASYYKSKPFPPSFVMSAETTKSFLPAPILYELGAVPAVSSAISSSYKPFSVASFNLLANCYLHSNTDYPAQVRAASWASKINRVEAMKKELLALNCDILCLQEVELYDFDRTSAESIVAEDAARLAKKLAVERKKYEKEISNNQLKNSKENCNLPTELTTEMKANLSSLEHKISEKKSFFSGNSSQDIGSFLRSAGYEIIVQHDKGRGESHRVGLAICYRKSVFNGVNWVDHRSRALLAALELRKSHHEKEICVEELKEREDRKESQNDSSNSTAVEANSLVYLAVVHLEGHPFLVQERFNQMKSALKEVSKQQQKLSNNTATSSSKRDQASNSSNNGADVADSGAVSLHNTIVCGDFNCNNHSAIYELLLRRKLPEKYTDKENNVAINTENFAHNFNFLDAYSSNPPKFTYARPNRSWLIDFLFYSAPNLHCFAVQKVFRDKEEEENIFSTGLPTPQHVSDHLPICAAFVVNSSKS